MAGTNSKNTIGDVYLGEFVKKIIYYFQFGDERVISFDLKKKSVISALEKGKSELSLKFKESSSDFARIEDVMELMK